MSRPLRTTNRRGRRPTWLKHRVSVISGAVMRELVEELSLAPLRYDDDGRTRLRDAALRALPWSDSILYAMPVDGSAVPFLR